MTSEMVWMAFGSLLAAALLTSVARRIYLSQGLMDIPNIRSSHKVPTARGGGSAIVLTSVCAWVGLSLMNPLDSKLLIALTGGGMAIATVGFLDDNFRLSARIRFVVHLAAAFWALAWLGGLPSLLVGGRIISFGSIGDVLAVVGIVWVTNLFNFMDGIDGIASSEAAFVTFSGALLGLLMGPDEGEVAIAFLLGATCCGFLVWNWSPAKIFMGDVGSGYLGYVIAVLAIAEARTNPVALFVWLTLGGVFFADSTVTLIRRLVRGERVYEAHRSHAYQWLARRWNSHRRVTILTILVNVCWLMPLAGCCVLFPSHAWWISLGSLVPLIVLVLIAGAGRPETISVT